VGRVNELGANVTDLAIGQRVGVAWLHRTCGVCRFCRTSRENLCESADFTGWTADGGFATEIKAPAAFIYPLPDDLPDLDAAPLLCAGIIGYRALKLTGIDTWAGAHLGLYGFGAAGHIAIQVARGRGAEVYVCTRDHDRHQTLAAELGATWVGGTVDPPPVRLDAAITCRRDRSARPGRASSRWHAGLGRHPHDAHPELSLRSDLPRARRPLSGQQHPR
jgi:propanol-preferring alcohol dehydrogenase